MELTQNEPVNPTPTPAPNPPKPAKRNTLLHVTIGLVIGMLLIAGGFLFYQLLYTPEPIETEITPVETASPSASPSAESVNN